MIKGKEVSSLLSFSLLLTVVGAIVNDNYATLSLLSSNGTLLLSKAHIRAREP